MEKLCTYENLSSYAYSNDKIVKQPVIGIAVEFFGLGGMDMYKEDTMRGKLFAENGIITLLPYHNPWAWMNRDTVAFTDEIIDVIIEKYGLPDDIPIVSYGGSMGGQQSLVYARYAKRTPVAVVSNCPVCDLPFHFTERRDLPRTFYSAFFGYDGTINDALASASPLHLVPTMPNIDYTVFHCDHDRAVRIDRHSDPFVAKMKEAGKNITYYVVLDRDHCDLTEEMWKKFHDTIIEKIIDNRRV